VLGVMIRRFEILPDPQTTDDTMAPVEHFFVVPKCVEPLLPTYMRILLTSCGGQCGANCGSGRWTLDTWSHR
jgi:hypothetical protein